MKILLTLLISLCLTAPAWALSYTGSAVLDWSALTFSGISSTVFTSQPFLGGAAQMTYAIVQPPFVPDDPHYMTEWTTVTYSSFAPDVGTGLAVASPTVLSASASLLGVGDFGVASGRFGELLAHESGALSISIPYVITQAVAPNLWGAPNPVTGSFASTNVWLGFGDKTSEVTLDARAGTGSRSGTLISTLIMSAGELTSFGLTASTGGSVRSVPMPDTFWPTAIGIVGLAGFAAWKRRAQA